MQQSISTFSLDFPQVYTILYETVEWRLLSGREKKQPLAISFRCQCIRKRSSVKSGLTIYFSEQRDYGILPVVLKNRVTSFQILVQQTETRRHFVRGVKSQSEAQNLHYQLQQELDLPQAVGLSVLITPHPCSTGPNIPKSERKFIFATCL